MATDAGRTRAAVPETHPRIAGATLDGVPAGPEGDRVHGVPADQRARRGGLDGTGEAEPGRFQDATAGATRTAADPGREFQTVGPIATRTANASRGTHHGPGRCR